VRIKILSETTSFKELRVYFEVPKTSQKFVCTFCHLTLTSTLYTTRRKPLIGRFYNNARGKIGKQSLAQQTRNDGPHGF